jgi:hypothetical protein
VLDEHSLSCHFGEIICPQKSDHTPQWYFYPRHFYQKYYREWEHILEAVAYYGPIGPENTPQLMIESAEKLIHHFKSLKRWKRALKILFFIILLELAGGIYLLQDDPPTFNKVVELFQTK